VTSAHFALVRFAPGVGPADFALAIAASFPAKGSDVPKHGQHELPSWGPCVKADI